MKNPIIKSIIKFCAIFLLIVSDAFGQELTGYELRYYQSGAQSPFQSQSLPIGSYVCNQDSVLSTINTNPNKAIWDDPNASGRACIFTETSNGPLVSFPVGNYEATLVAINTYGMSPESNRAPFAVGTAPAVPTGVKIVR